MGFGALATQLPSLDWTLARLTGVWAKDGEMISCPLPGHDDSTPSFNLWDADADGVPQRWGCFGCGQKGDVVSLICVLEGMNDPDAMRRAGELFEEERCDATPRDREQRPNRELRDLEPLYASFVAGFDVRRLEQFQRYMRSKGLDGEELEAYAMNEWGWAVSDAGAVAVPHRSPDGTLTGIKYRRSSGKSSEPGSKYEHLYGVWRLSPEPRPVLLCEGESDTLWAAWALRTMPIDVLGLPSGAHQRYRDEWLEVLDGRELTLAFDSDEAGGQAARIWLAKRPDAMLMRLPEGEDLLSCGIPVPELLEFARMPRRDLGMVAVEDGRLVMTSSKGNVPIADFAIRPVRELYTDEGPAWEVRIHGTHSTELVRASDLHSRATATRWANRMGGAWFGARGPVEQGVLNWLAAESVYLPLERASTKAGKIGRSFVGPGFCIGPDRYRYLPPVLGDAKLQGKIHIAEGDWDPLAILALERLNEPSVMAAIIGWTCASMLRGKKAPAPPLFVSGESGAGKTSLLSALFRSLGFQTETNLTTTTPFGVDCMINSCIGFPVWFDEYRGGARADSMERLGQFLRDAYMGQVSMKGGMTDRATELTEVSTWSGIVVSGEMSSNETSHRDRMVMLDLQQSGQNEKALHWLLESPERTAGLGHALLAFLSKRPAALFQVRPFGPPDAPDRFRRALGYVQAGWAAWKEFRWEQQLHDQPAEPDYRGLAGERSEHEDPWLQAIKACEGVRTRDGTPIVQREQDGATTLIPSEVIVEAKRIGIMLPARANELVSWLRAHYGEVEDTRTFGGRRAKRVRGL